MKLLDKVKNMFTEEIEEEVQVEQINTQKKKKAKVETIEDVKEQKKKEEEKKPVFFTDDDFNDLNFDHREEKKEPTKKVKKERKTYFEPEKDYREDVFEKHNDNVPLPKRSKEPYEEVKVSKKFKPTPIISPVYGVLDKNYHKEDIVDKTDENYQAVDGLSVDSIRNKAYGTLEDELENTLFGNNSILFDDEEKESKKDKMDIESIDENDNVDEKIEKIDNDLDELENITMDIGKELDSLLSKKEETDESEDDLFDLIDNMYEGDEE